MTHEESRERRKQIVKLAKTGMSLADICNQTDASMATVRFACAEHGVGFMTHEQKTQRRMDIANDVNGGMDVNRAAKKYGMCRESIMNACKEHGVEVVLKHFRNPVSAFKILKMLLDGKSGPVIAEKFNISKQRVSHVAVAARKAGFKV
jgi:uncharacterized protein YerC